MIARTSSSSISAAVPGSEPSPAALQLGRGNPDTLDAERRRALEDFERREGVDVQAGRRLLDGAADRQIGLAGVARMDAALQADFDGAALPGLAARRSISSSARS